jgi:hypothetical protein
MDEFNKCMQESEEILIFALDEFKKAKREQNEMLARQVCEKAYLALIKALNAFFIKKGKKLDELPLGERGRRYFLHSLAGKQLQNFYDSFRSRLHIDGFHEGIIIFDELEDDLNEIEKFIHNLKNGYPKEGDKQ